MKKSLIALAFGTLGLGIAEFVMMGILPDVAKDLGISIPMAGHFISAYALGVCVGAPVLTLARKYPLKHILLVLVTLIMIWLLYTSDAADELRRLDLSGRRDINATTSGLHLF